MSGSAVDASIALNANAPKPINPLVQAGQYAQTLGGLTSLQQARINIAKQNALAQAYQGATIDPRTGLPDAASVTSSLQGAQYGGLAIPEAIQANQAMRLNAIKNAQATSQVYTSTVGALARLGSSVTNGQVYGALKALNIAGYPGVDKMVEQAQDGMPVDPTGSDPQHGQKLHDWLMNTYLRDVGPGVETPAITPNLHPMDNGPGIGLVNTSTTAGATGASYGYIPKGNAPEVSTQIMQIGVGQDGQPIMGTRQQAIERANGGALNGAFGAPAGAPPATGAPSQPGAAPPTPTASGAVPGGGFVGGLGPAQEADIKSTADASIAQYNQAHAGVNGYAGRLVQLQQALRGLQNSPTGPGTDETNNIKSFLLAQDPGILKAMGLSPNEVTIANHDMANKYLTQYATNAATAFGAGTDHQLAATLTGNASTHISNLAAQDVVKTATALERMKAAQMQAFDQSALPPHEFNKWSVGWQKNIDARAFEFDLLTPDQRTALVKSLGPPGSKPYEAFAQKLLAAQKSGFITPPAPNAGP